MKVRKEREGMHTYKGYIQSLQIVQGGNQHPDSTPRECHAPEFDCTPVTRKPVGSEGREGWRLQNWCSRQLSGGPASGVSDIDGCMRCKSVSGAAKLFAHCRASRAISHRSYTVSSRVRRPSTADHRGSRCTSTSQSATRKVHLKTNELSVDTVWVKKIMRRPAHASKVAHSYYWLHTTQLCGSFVFLVDRRPDSDGAALVGHRRQADRSTKRWCACLQDCCQPPSSERQQPSPTHIPHHICYQTHVNTLGVSDTPYCDVFRPEPSPSQSSGSRSMWDGDTRADSIFNMTINKSSWMT